MGSRSEQTEIVVGDFVEGRSVVSSDVPVRGVVNGVFNPKLVSVTQGVNSRLCQDPRTIPITGLSKEEIDLLGDFMEVHLSTPKLQIGDIVKVECIINNQWVLVCGRLCSFGNIIVCVEIEPGSYRWGKHPVKCQPGK